MQYEHIKVPPGGHKITVNPDGSINVPDHPIVPFIEGDGIGIDVTPVMLKVVNAAVKNAYGERRRIEWMEIYSGEKATALYGEFLPDETLHALREYARRVRQVVLLDRLADPFGVAGAPRVLRADVPLEVGELADELSLRPCDLHGRAVDVHLDVGCYRDGQSADS